MLDINQYTYTNNPFSHNEKFNVFPLDDPGVKTYYHDKEAHTHTYLDKINPREMRKIYAEKKVFDEQIEKIKNAKLTAYNKKFYPNSVEKNGTYSNLKSQEKLENCQTRLKNEEESKQECKENDQICNYDNNENCQQQYMKIEVINM